MKIWRKITTRHRKVLEMICQRTVFNSQSNISNLIAVIKLRRVSLNIKQQPLEEVQLSSSHPIGGRQRLKKSRSRKLQRNRNLQRRRCESLK